jgi:hypothetical protein
MNATQNTQSGAPKVLVIAALAAALGTGLGGCATNADGDGFAQRQSNDLSHELTRAENRVQADRVRVESPHTSPDQAAQRENDLSHEVIRAENRVQVDHLPMPTNDNDPRGFHGLPSVQ